MILIGGNCCRIETIDGTAEAQKDYTPVKEILVFEKGETIKYIDIQIIDDNEWEPDEIFFVKLSLDSFNDENVVIGHLAIQEITIIDDDGECHLLLDDPTKYVILLLIAIKWMAPVIATLPLGCWWLRALQGAIMEGGNSRFKGRPRKPVSAGIKGNETIANS